MSPTPYSAADKRRIVAQQIVKMKAVTKEGWTDTVQVIRLPDGRIVRPGQASYHDIKMVAELIGGEPLLLKVRITPENDNSTTQD